MHEAGFELKDFGGEIAAVVGCDGIVYCDPTYQSEVKRLLPLKGQIDFIGEEIAHENNSFAPYPV